MAEDIPSGSESNNARRTGALAENPASISTLGRSVADMMSNIEIQRKCVNNVTMKDKMEKLIMIMPDFGSSTVPHKKSLIENIQLVNYWKAICMIDRRKINY